MSRPGAVRSHAAAHTAARPAPISRPGTPTTFTTAQRLAQAVGGQPLYTEHGPSNRLVLSLASGIDTEVDFALERLLQVSQIDVTLLQIDLYPGLVEALCDTVHNINKSTGKGKSRAHTCFASQALEGHIRRATQASIVLRNLACEPDNLQQLWERPQVLATTLSVLQHTAPLDASVPTDAPLAQDTSQLRLMLLDILTVFAPHLSLQSPASAPMETDGPESDEPAQAKTATLSPLPEELQAQVQRVYPLVSQLCWSSDRAMILSAYYILAALATSTNASTFTFPCHLDGLNDTNSVTRALQLLPLPDMELVSATLQFLFCYTDISSKNADSLASRDDIHHILKMLLSKCLFGGSRQDLVTGAKPAAAQHIAAKNHKIPTGPGLLPAAEMRLLLALPEPQRTTSWCQWVYVTQANSEIRQTELWSNYKNQFLPFATEEAPLPQPGDFLSSLQASFNSQVRVVRSTVDQSFVVRGLQQRDRPGMAATLRKHWTQHGAPASLGGNPAQLSDEALLLAAFKSLLQNQSTNQTQAKSSIDSSSPEIRSFVWQPRTLEGLPAGHALYSILVLRNLSRAIRSATAPIQRSQGDQVLSYLTPFGETEDDPTDTFVHGAGQASDALLQMEESLLVLAMGTRALATYLSEILNDISAVSKATMTPKKSQPPVR